ncbi:MAG TPA: biopolymer transporter ExbD [Kofleriaceae bacterium]|nr:biopolymer transporter ExbD [Kofleriaceae bacterium]
MAGGSLYHDDDDDSITDINVTPFVDVALVLLVIFLVTARLIVARGIVVDKPKAATGSEVKTTLRVTVDKQGALYVNGTKYDDAAAASAKIADIAKDMPESRAVITGDGGAAYRDIMHAIDVVKAAKVQKIALENAPLPTKE